MKRLTGGQIGCLLLMSLFIVFMLFSYCDSHKLAGLYHYIIGTKNIEEPLVKEEFHFDKEGYERIYKIKPKYRGYYNIFIKLENFDMLCDEIEKKCDGEIIINYYDKKKNIIYTKIKRQFGCYNLSRNYGRWGELIRLDKFPYYNSIFREDIDSIIVRVNKPMTCFPKGGDKKTYLIIEYNYNL